MMKPTIGITVGPRDDGQGIEGYAPYAEAITDAGGEPLFLHPKPVTPDVLAQGLNGLQGLLLTGGIDIHPDNYPSRNEPGDENMSADALIKAYRMKCSLERDAYEIPLARAAFEARLPILGICRGFQLLNVALGGSLVKDIRTGRKHWAVRKDETDDGNPGESRKHMITIISRTKLAEILGDCPILVNSRHHQGITEKEMSHRVRPSAFAPDDIIEAIEAEGHPWALAVQWHPEKKADSYVHEQCRPLFAAFVATAGKRLADLSDVALAESDG